MPPPPPLPLAVAQIAPTRSHAQGQLAAHEATTAHPGHGLLVLPEGALNGYFPDDPAAARQAALPSSALVDLAAALPPARAVLMGFTEALAGKLYTSAALLWGGRVHGVCRKVRGTERGFARGAPAPVFEVAGVGLGVLLCSDARDADDALRLRAEGAEVLAFPLNNLLPIHTAQRWRSEHLAISQARARETACWVLTADVVHAAPTHRAYGCSVILDPRGHVRARVPEGQAGTAAL